MKNNYLDEYFLSLGNTQEERVKRMKDDIEKNFTPNNKALKWETGEVFKFEKRFFKIFLSNRNSFEFLHETCELIPEIGKVLYPVPVYMNRYILFNYGRPKEIYIVYKAENIEQNIIDKSFQVLSNAKNYVNNNLTKYLNYFVDHSVEQIYEKVIHKIDYYENECME